MSQVRVEFDFETQTVDFAMDSRGFISLEGGWETAVLYSLGTNRRARPEPGKPEEFGWWADAYPDAPGDKWGSRLWTIHGRGKLIPQHLRMAQLFGEECLRWMKETGAVETIQVVPLRVDPDILKLEVGLYAPDGSPLYSNIWEVHRNAVQ